MRAVIATGILAFGGVARAGVPFINFEGVGGVALNPVAYSANDGEEGLKAGFLEIAKPRIGTWYFHLGESSIDWTTLGIATSFNKRLEVSFGYESIAIQNVSNVQKVDVGGKLLLLEENAFGTKFLPALSLGVIWKQTNYHPSSDASGLDVYAVATKMIGELPAPVLLSVGALSTQAEVMGTIGFNSQRAIVAFANIDVVPVSWLAVGAEYHMGPNYGASGGGYVDGDYFDIHAGWFVTKGFTLAAAYAYAATKTNAGAPVSTANPIGFGPGFTLTGQYAF